MIKLFKTLFLLGFLAISSWANANEPACDVDQDDLQPKKHKQNIPGTWTPLTNQPTFVATGYPGGPGPGGANAQLLLTDGTILVQNTDSLFNTSEIWKLTPDINGSYINGTWSQVASLPDNYAPYAGATAVLADGRVIVQGGEYNGTNFHFALANVGYIYDPVTDVWTRVPPPPFFRDFYPPRRLFSPNTIGDASSIVLADGTYMLQDKMSGQAALLDLATLTWTETGTSTKADWNDEEGLTLLPNGKVLTVDCYAGSSFLPNLYPFPPSLTNSELYDPMTGQWSSAGSTIVSMTDKVFGEMGPALLRPDGKVIQFGGNGTGQNSFYDYKKNKWTVGPTFPIIGGQLSGADNGAALLPNGNVLVAVAVYPFVSGLYFFELTYDTNELIQQPTIPNSSIDFSAELLVLPTGQVMSTDDTNDVEIYTAGDTSYDSDWAPVVKKAPKSILPGNTYKIEGKRFNGMSQAMGFGDDYQAATNYPLVRITNKATGHVFYARTHDHSSMAVASKETVHTFFDVPANIELGKSKLEVVANGIPSKPISIVVK